MSEKLSKSNLFALIVQRYGFERCIAMAGQKSIFELHAV